MKTSASFFLSFLAATGTLVAADVDSDVKTLAGQIPSCVSSCVSAVFTQLKCAQGDWGCFCTIQANGDNGYFLYASNKISQCASANSKGGCQLDYTRGLGPLAKICAEEEGPGGHATGIGANAMSGVSVAISAATAAFANGTMTDAMAMTTGAGGSTLIMATPTGSAAMASGATATSAKAAGATSSAGAGAVGVQGTGAMLAMGLMVLGLVA